MSGAAPSLLPVPGTDLALRWSGPPEHPAVELVGPLDTTDPAVVAALAAAVQAGRTSPEPTSTEPTSTEVQLIWDEPVDEPASLPPALAAALGLAPTRQLFQLRRALPVPADHPERSLAPALRLRPFQRGRDEAAWQRANNLAFATHPSQGNQDLASLEHTLAEPWVDLDGFLVTDDDERPGELAGFCWTRIHPATDHEPALGEIFVIGVHPSQQGRRLGASLVLAGLDHLAWRGITTGMLWVEADNAPALRLYDRLGFAPHLRRLIHS